jgi:hypothetical protein
MTKKAMIAFLAEHFRYDTMNSWNRAPGAGSVWIVSWHAMDGQASGVHGVFEAESHARKEVEAMTRSPWRSVYKASQWSVTPNEGGQ